MKNNRTLRIVFIALLVAALGGSIAIAYKASNDKDEFHFKPEVSIAGVAIEDEGGSHLKIYPSIELINDLNIEAKIEELDFKVFYGKVKVLETLVKKDFTIKKTDTTSVTLPIEVKKETLKYLSNEFDKIRSDSVTLTLFLNFKLAVPLRGFREFKVERDIDVIPLRMLSVASRKLSLEKFSLRHPELELQMTLFNPNSFDVALRSSRVEMEVADDLLLEGSAAGVQEIKGNSNGEVTFDLRAEDLNVLKLAWKALARKDKTDFKSRLSFQLLSPNKLLNHCRFEITKNGKLDELNQ